MNEQEKELTEFSKESKTFTEVRN